MARKNNRPSGTNKRGTSPGAKAVRGMSGAGLSTNLKLTIAVVAVAIVAMGAALFLTDRGGPSADSGAVSATDERLVRPDSHKLSTAADGKVTVVEFLDFECEACGAAYPGVEKLRAEYADRITYVVRYFPLPGHRNAQPAALAVQAAANQGRFEAMYTKMFSTQSTWGEQQKDQTGTFEGFARDLGLDLDRYRADLADPATAARIEKDKSDGLSLGVTGTPGFFVNGKKFTERPTFEALKAAVDTNLAG
ncbi:thioredoxin domain-containing protein [Longispora urticae]